jgi:penicillin-binding protein 1B
MRYDVSSLGRLVIVLGTGVLAMVALCSAWAAWRVAGRGGVEPHLAIYADGASAPFAMLRGRVYEVREDRPLHAYPQLLIDAVILVEDRRFFQHRGLDLQALARAAWTDARHRRIVQGGSTLTQQLARGRYLTQERTLARKLKEALLALALEATRSKAEILEQYLNEVYMGHQGGLEIHGMATASRLYLGKEPHALRPSEVALLVGLIRSPNRSSPLVSPGAARQRRDLILRHLWREGRLAEAQYQRAVREPVRVVRGSTEALGYALDLIRKEVETRISDIARADGVRVFTSLDLAMQRAAQDAVATGVSRVEQRRRARGGAAVEGALVAIDVEGGTIKAIVGGRRYEASQFNRAVQARRQPGSLFKPFVYLAAFEVGSRGEDGGGLTPATLVEDRPLLPGDGRRGQWPRNIDGRYYGTVRVREALERSLNAATVRVGLRVGFERVLAQARALGIESPLRPDLPTLLGASEVSLLEVTAAYGAIARGGTWIRPTAVTRIVDGRGRILYDGRRESRRAASAQSAFLVTSLLQGVLDRGTAASVQRLGLTRAAAGKTGTSNDARDAWFVGYTPTLVAGVWVGVDSGAPLFLSGAQAALPIWTQFIERASADRERAAFQRPPGIVTAAIDPSSGLLAGAECPNGVEELFIQGTQPSATCAGTGSLLTRWLRSFFWR